MRINRPLVPIIALAAITLTACSSSGASKNTGSTGGGSTSGGSTSGGSTGTGGSTTQSSSGGGAAANTDVCSLFTAAKINSAFGITVGNGEKDPAAPNSCAWAKGTAPVFRVSVIKTAESDLSNELKIPGYKKTPTKLGDDSAFLQLPGTAADVQTSLIVVKSGQHYQFTLYRGPSGASQSATKDQAAIIALARPVVG